jgi:hypothetical protein
VLSSVSISKCYSDNAHRMHNAISQVQALRSVAYDSAHNMHLQDRRYDCREHAMRQQQV